MEKNNLRRVRASAATLGDATGLGEEVAAAPQDSQPRVTIPPVLLFDHLQYTPTNSHVYLMAV